jgi:hypothetical protein
MSNPRSVSGTEAGSSLCRHPAFERWILKSGGFSLLVDEANAAQNLHLSIVSACCTGGPGERVSTVQSL